MTADQMPDQTGGEHGLADPLPPAFEERVVTLQPGERRIFETADWTDALIVLQSGEIELESLAGHSEHLQSGAVFWLAGLPLRALHNAGLVPAVLVAVSRCTSAEGGSIMKTVTSKDSNDHRGKDPVVKFHATLELAGKTATGIEVPEAVVTGLGSSRRPAVRVTINGFTYRSTIAFMGGRYLVGVNADNRAAAGVAAGDELDVDIELDTEARDVSVPPEVARFLEADAAAREFFEGLSYSRKRLFTEPIEQAKTDETRRRRVDKALQALRERRPL